MIPNSVSVFPIDCVAWSPSCIIRISILLMPKITPIFTSFILATLLAGCGGSHSSSESAVASQDRKVRIELASFIPLSVNVIGEQLTHISNELDRISGGNVTFEIFEPNALVGPLEILDAVSDGKVDAGYGAAAFWAGKIPSAPLFCAIPFGPNSSEFLSWLYEGNGMKLYQEMYDTNGFDVKVFVCAIIPPETSGWFANEITSVDDLKDLKMRFFGLGGVIMGKLGVSVSVLPGGEIFPALEKGVIDATEYSLPSVDESQGFHKLVNYNYFPGWHQQSTTHELIINKSVWERLSKTQQAQIETACKSSILHSIAYCTAIQAPAMKRNEERGVQSKQWAPEMIDTFREIWEEVAAEESAKDPFFKKVWDDLQAFRAEYATWADRAFLR